MALFRTLSKLDVKARLRQFENQFDLGSQEFYDMVRFGGETVKLPEDMRHDQRTGWVTYCKLGEHIGLLD